jgi:tRNA-specific 2-thiouridylase
LDELKDQSYVLWGLQQDLLSRTILPLGKYRKTEIRQMANDFGYPELAKKSESYEICFVPDNDYRGFLKHRVEGLEEKVNGGWFVDKNGLKLGGIKGIRFIRLASAKGWISLREDRCSLPKYSLKTNVVVLGDEEDLQQSEMLVSKLNWLKYDGIEDGQEVFTKIRYKDKGALSHLYYNENKNVRVLFLKT